MKTLLVASALALSAVLFAVPVSAHHNSLYTDDISEMMPITALETHNEAVEDVLDRLYELGVTGAMAGSTTSNDMDPADSAQGDTCAIWNLDGCDTEPAIIDNIRDDFEFLGMDRAPETTEPPEITLP